MLSDSISKFVSNGNKTMLLYGVSGTEKLKIAMKTACSILNIDYSRHVRYRFDPVGIVSDRGCWEILSMHPGYDYSTFIGEKAQGPTSNQNFRRGYFSWLCKKATEMRDLHGRSDNSRNFVLILDGIERVNLPDMFGEMLQALALRDIPVSTAFTRSISIPDNLYIIAIANVASPRLLPQYGDIARFFTPVHVYSDANRLPKLLADYNIPEKDLLMYTEKCVQLNNTVAKIAAESLHLENAGIGQEFLAKVKDYMIRPDISETVVNNIDSKMLDSLWSDIIEPLIFDMLGGTSYFRSVSKLDAAKAHFTKL